MSLILVIFSFIIHISFVDAGCSGGVGKCHWSPWESWDSCSRSCGGGYSNRFRPFCCKASLADDTLACLKNCGISYQDYRDESWESRDCNTICYNGGHYNDGCKCPDEYYGYCCDNKCPDVKNCRRRRCSYYWNNICLECNDDETFFRRTNGDTLCERMCSWNGHYCWPGTCVDDLTKGCTCAADFAVTRTDNETSCQPTKSPSILTCDSTISIGTNGDKKQALSNGSSTLCNNLRDVYGNLQPSSLEYKFLAEFTIDYSKFSKPDFIKESTIGVTDATIYLIHTPIIDSKEILASHHLLEDISSSMHATTTWDKSGQIGINGSILQNGESLCIKYEAKGGGYLKGKNTVSHAVLQAVPYTKTTSSEEICYYYDNAPPSHCLADMKCTDEPIQIQSRITRSTNTTVTFTGWSDPIPYRGTSVHASSIELYTISVHEVNALNGTLDVDLGSVFNAKVTESITGVDVCLESDKPKLYAIILEVKDIADNVRHARRFMLYDNSSFIEISQDDPYRVTSASTETNYKWQTHHHNISLSWKDHFVNQFYLHNQLLNAIEPDAMISGIYEQNNGLLPVSGTPNVYGIIEYTLAWSLDGKGMTEEVSVQNFLNQSFTHDFNVRDGQSYTFQVKSIDIAGNTLADNVTVNIDRSPPHINNMWLVKDDHKTLFVHHNTDLSHMEMHFEALDSHSGIENIEWRFGVTDTGVELATGHLSVGEISNTSCPAGVLQCYCPDIGQCEYYNYTIPLNKLVDANKNIGNHNRAYYFTVKITNKALLTNIEHVDVLVDDSAPETGVIYEGPIDSNDIDYTSDTSYTVHWHGFIDHESGIKEYRVALSPRCLAQTELYNSSSTSDVEFYAIVPFTREAITIPANFTGVRFVSIIALNNAMVPSMPVCSDGITRDLSPPELRNLTFDHASWSESIVCHHGNAWLFHSSLAKVQLQNHTACSQLCTDIYDRNKLISVLPFHTEESRGIDVAEFLCTNLPTYSDSTIIYLPNDHINIKWDVEEVGSQIEDFYVALGVDPSEENAPSIETYSSLSRRRNINRRHTGTGSNKLFYIFIKSINKAKQETVTTIGPVLIDETPPLMRRIPKVLIQDDIVVGWDNDTFYDMEQDEPINSIFWQIGHGTNYVTPLLQWNLYSSVQCPAFSGGCFKYPLNKLQQQDTDLALDFHIKLHVYNNAGHALQIVTEEFQLPSKYPPGHGIVIDIDPGIPELHMDTNVHFTPNTLCVEWSGFRHHQNVQLEIGIGLDNATDDVVSFMPLNVTNQYCINSSSFKFGVRYFSLIRAKCSAGSTVSSSDGVIIVDDVNLKKLLNVLPGESCTSKSQSSIQTHLLNSGSNELDFTFHSGVGQFYHIQSHLDSFNISSDNGIISNILGETEFVPFTMDPVLRIVSKSEMSNVSLESIITITQCSPRKYYATRERISTHWYVEFDIPNGISFETSIAAIEGTTGIENIFNYITPFKNVGRELFHVFNNISASEEFSYMTVVRVCSRSRCIEPVFSKQFTIAPVPPEGKFKVSRLEESENCSSFHLLWEKFTSKDSVLFYQWAISKDASANDLLTPWQTELVDKIDLYEVSTCIDFPLHIQSVMYSCIRTFTDSGTHTTVCNEVSHSSFKKYRPNVVYDFNGHSEAWKDIKKVLSSSYIGDAYSLILDNEMNIDTSNADVLGFMLYATERNVTWSLMKTANIFIDCNLEPDCVTSTVNRDGYARFDPKFIDADTLYFICAHSNMHQIVRETYTEVQDEISSCSNGFILDNSPPKTGKVSVSNSSGYLRSMRGLRMTWDEFYESVDATLVGFPNRIMKYEFGIGSGLYPNASTALESVRTSVGLIKSIPSYTGSQPGCEDVHPFTDVGYSRQSYINEINVTDGSILYFSVIGTNYAGFKTVSTSDEIIVDASPPQQGEIIVSTNPYPHMEIPVITSRHLSIYLTGFEDAQSGISYFQVGIGTHELVDDLMPMVDYVEKNIKLSLNEDRLVDGYGYFILVTAVNRAGLKTSVISTYVLVDRSSPTGGQVLDGNKVDEKDVDYQIDLDEIWGHWKGFNDIHSGIACYSVGLGTRPFSDDIEPLTNVGLNQDTVWKSIFELGQRFYILVEACNGAGLCTQRSSDGIVLDNSPPTQGVVWVGSEDNHRKYQPHGSTLQVRWTGFDDPQSGIDFYEVCIGTKPQLCDLLPIKNCLLRSNIMLTGLSLPMKTDIYATVIAHNRVGLNVSKTSDSFRIDESAPTVVTKPNFNLDYNSISGKTGQWDNSVLRLYWEFKDNESPISSHYVSLVTHHEGHTPVEQLKLGAQNEITISLNEGNLLHNGDKYTAVVTSCNEAGLCSNVESDELVIDSTPPHIGGFKPPLTWLNYISTGQTRSNISLTWYGFHDQESGIEKYFISASRTYSGNELVQDAIVEVNNQNKSSDLTRTFTLSETIHADDVIILTIWAENAVGLNSSVARVSVNTIASSTHDALQAQGVLELEKHSCDIHFCNKDCTCAVVGKPCADVTTNSTCTTLNITADMFGHPLLDVHPGLHSHPLNITASSSCLAGHWKLKHKNLTLTGIQRFEWSMGLLHQPIGEGIFNLKSESPWYDVGHRTEVVHCLPVNKSLLHGHDYVVYVKAWYAMDLNAIFTSEAVRVDHTPPAVRRGWNVIDSDSLCMKDVDIIDWMDTITACWANVFMERQGKIVHYTVSLGTASHSDDVLLQTYTGLNTSITLKSLSLTHGTRYFFTVTAYNNVGLQKSTTSDGFIIDMDVPNIGVVHNTEYMKSRDFQSSNTSLSFSWHGFHDLFSGIKTYMIAVTTNPKEGKDLQLHVNFTDVQFQTKITLSELDLNHGHTYYGLVKVIDYSGHSSDIVSSKGVTIDITPPLGYECTHFIGLERYTNRSSTYEGVHFEIKANLSMNTLYRVHGQTESVVEIPKFVLSVGSHIAVLPLASSHDGKMLFDYDFLVPSTSSYDVTIRNENGNATLKMTLYECDDVQENTLKAVNVQQVAKTTIAVKFFVLDRESSLKRVLVGAGTSEGGFQIKPLSTVHRGNNNDIIYTQVPHGTPVHVTVRTENNAGLTSTFNAKPIVIDHTEPIITDISGELFSSEVNVSGNSVHFTNVSIRWVASDTESGVKVCFCSLGSSPGLTNIQQQWQSSTLSTCMSDDVELPHGSVIYANVRCVNSIEMFTVASSKPFVVSIESSVTTSASALFIPLNEESSLYTTALGSNISLQSSMSGVLLQWDGFEDTTDILNYEYRILKNDQVTYDWKSLEGRQTVFVDDFQLHDGRYNAEIRAINIGGHVSDSVYASLVVHGGQPRLTGHPLDMTKEKDILRIDWSQAFRTSNDVPYSYSIYIGTRHGFSDVLDLIYTSGTSYEIKIPSSTIITPHPKEIFLRLECIYATGLRSSIDTNYIL